MVLIFSFRGGSILRGFLREYLGFSNLYVEDVGGERIC